MKNCNKNIEKRNPLWYYYFHKSINSEEDEMTQKKAVIAKGRGKIMVNEVMDFITGYDKEVGEAIQAECARQRRNLERCV